METIFNEKIKPLALEMLQRAELPAAPEKAEFRRNVFLQELASYRYEKQEGQIIVKDSQGFEVRNEHGHDLSVHEFVQSEFNKYFDLSDLPINATECLARLKDPRITPADRKKYSDLMEQRGWKY